MNRGPEGNGPRSFKNANCPTTSGPTPNALGHLPAVTLCADRRGVLVAREGQIRKRAAWEVQQPLFPRSWSSPIVESRPASSLPQMRTLHNQRWGPLVRSPIRDGEI
jgi:hypothetical protein